MYMHIKSYLNEQMKFVMLHYLNSPKNLSNRDLSNHDQIKNIKLIKEKQKKLAYIIMKGYTIDCSNV